VQYSCTTLVEQSISYYWIELQVFRVE